MNTRRFRNAPPWRRWREHVDIAQAVTAALEEAAVADRDSGDGKAIEIYVRQIGPIVERVLAGAARDGRIR